MTAAELDIMIEAKDKSARALKSATTRVGRFGASIKTQALKMKTAFIGFAKRFKLAFLAIGIAIAGALVKMKQLVRGGIELGLQLDKMSKQTGLSASQIAKLGYAMKQEHGDVEKLTRGLLMLNRYIGYAGEGQKLYLKHFERLDIAIRKTDGTLRSSYDIFMDMVKAVSKGEMATEDYDAVLTLLGGRIAKDLLPAMKLGVAWFGQMGKEYKELTGLTDEQIDNHAKMSKAYQDKVDAMTTAWDGFKMKLAEIFRPHMQTIVEWMTEKGIPKLRNLLDENKGAFREWALIAARETLTVAKGVLSLGKGIALTTGLFHKMNAAIKQLMIEEAAGDIKVAKEELERLDKPFRERIKGLEDIIKSNKKEIASMKEKGVTSMEEIDKMKELALYNGIMEDAIVSLEKERAEETKSMRTAIADNEAFKTSLEGSRNETIKNLDALEKWGEGLDKIKIKLTETRQKVDDIREEMKKGVEKEPVEVEKKRVERPVKMEATVRGIKTRYDVATGKVVDVEEKSRKALSDFCDTTIEGMKGIGDEVIKMKTMLEEKIEEMDKLKLKFSES